VTDHRRRRHGSRGRFVRSFQRRVTSRGPMFGRSRSFQLTVTL
jgi:hypothetical protein